MGLKLSGVEVVEQKQSEPGSGVMEHYGPKLAWMEEWKVLVFWSFCGETG
jgi:hypothetical protein